jgi:predicted O-methyltransferase YrrM
MKLPYNIKFTGDLSLEDAGVLLDYANQSADILEFGSGGSTQLFSQSTAKTIVSVETDPGWIALTKSRLNLLDKIPVTFIEYTTKFNQEFDLIFVDGIDYLRREFAIETWKYLRVGGTMIFHDTRRFGDFQNCAWVAQLYFNEISQILVNTHNSNITVLHKKAHEPYVNWNHTENKPQWAYGIPDGADRELWEYKPDELFTTSP